MDIAYRYRKDNKILYELPNNEKVSLEMTVPNKQVHGERKNTAPNISRRPVAYPHMAALYAN